MPERRYKCNNLYTDFKCTIIYNLTPRAKPVLYPFAKKKNLEKATMVEPFIKYWSKPKNNIPENLNKEAEKLISVYPFGVADHALSCVHRTQDHAVQGTLIPLIVQVSHTQVA